MPTLELILGIVLGLISLGIVVAVLLQPGKDKRLSGAIAGGTDTFYGKTKSEQREHKLNKLTVALCVAFFALVLVLYCVVAV